MMHGRFGLFAVSLAALCVLPVAASATNRTGSIAAKIKVVAASAANDAASAGTITVKSRGCSGPVNKTQLRYETYACATIKLPREAVAGQPMTATYTFKARAELDDIAPCFVPVAATKCAVMKNTKKKYPVFPMGKIVTEVLQMTAPDKPGTYGLYNNTRYYKLSKSQHKDASFYWSVPAFARVVAAPAAS